MKKLLLVLFAGLALTGCASRTGTAMLVGGTVGYLIGQDQHRHAPVVYTETVVVPAHSSHCQGYATYNERAACERGVRQRLIEEQRRREQDAYRSGYGR
jgi:uncharacterized protein YcfL